MLIDRVARRSPVSFNDSKARMSHLEPKHYFQFSPGLRWTNDEDEKTETNFKIQQL